MDSGADLKYLVLLNKGQPTTNLTYTLYNQNNTIILTSSVSISVGQMSYLIEIPGASNILSKPLLEQMRLSWTYNTSSQAVSEEFKYVLHAPIAFPVSNDNVRKLLGVNSDELPDEEIDLFAGYLSYLGSLPVGADLSSFENAGNLSSYKISVAIEAAAALNIFPTLQIRLPKRYDSGTSEYERWTTINWDGLFTSLSNKVFEGLQVVDSELSLYDVTTIFGLSDPRVDAITGI